MKKNAESIPAMIFAALIAIVLIFSWSSGPTPLKSELHRNEPGLFSHTPVDEKTGRSGVREERRAVSDRRNEGRVSEAPRITSPEQARPPVAAQTAREYHEPVPQEKPAYQEEKSESGFWRSTLTDWLIVLALAVLAWCAYGIRRSTGDLSDATQRLADTIEENARRQARVNLTIEPEMLFEGVTRDVRFNIKNAGTTSAFNLQERVKVWIDEVNTTSPMTFGAPSGEIRTSLAPNEGIAAAEPFYVKEDEIEDIRQGRKALWAALDLSYVDSFGSRRGLFVTACLAGESIENSQQAMVIKQYTAE
jgi:hypothetical protein